MQAFVVGNEALSFTLTDRFSAYGWMTDTLKQFHYGHFTCADKGVLRQYLSKVTGFSRAQVARYIKPFTEDGAIRVRRRAPAVPLVRCYTAEDIRLLAEMEALHGTVSGAITRELCERAFTMHREERFERLAGISNGHLYNLRRHKAYQAKGEPSTKRAQLKFPSANAANPPRTAAPAMCACYLCDWDGLKGVYLIIAVDEVTQFQAVFAVEHISEAYLLPVLAAMMAVFPFVIRNVHADNGSQYINYKVAKLLEKLRIEQTKSRSRQSNDNALVESKNTSTVRKTWA